MYRVLIAEDEALVRVGLKTMPDWAGMGMQIVGDAGDGRKAYDLYRELHPDILITDIRMPGLDGLELIRKIRETDSRIKIIILSCLDEFRLVQQAMELGVSSYILKLTAGIAEIEQTMRNVRAVMDEEAKSSAPPEWLDLSLVREQVLNQFLLHKTLSAEDFLSCMKKLRLRIFEENLMAAVLRFPAGSHFSQGGREVQAGHLHRAALEAIRRVLEQMPFGECCGDLHHGYCLILSFPGISEAEAVKQCGEALFEVQALLRKELGEAPFWGVSTPANSAGMLPELFQEANDLCRETGLTEDVPPKVAEAVRYLQEHFAENISLQSVADHLNITPNYLGHLFVRFLETPFTDFLGALRVEEAKRLLEDPGRRIYEAAEAVGIFNPSYFIRVFKKHTGMTPNEYRSGGSHESQ